MRVMTEAAWRKALAEASIASGSVHRRRLRLIREKNRSTTPRRGWLHERFKPGDVDRGKGPASPPFGRLGERQANRPHAFGCREA